MTNYNNISVLLAEDERDLLLLVQEELKEEGFTVFPADNGLDAYRLFLESKPGIVVLDIDMPGIDGLKLCAQIRKMDEQTPIIFTSGMSRTDDVKAGFEAGANDYLKKPYDVEELVIRIKHLTKSIHAAPSEHLFHIGSYKFYSDTHVLSCPDGTNHTLSYTENSMLTLLAQHTGDIVSRDMIIDLIWENKPAIDSRAIDVYISKLRRYLAQDSRINIINCYGRGYRLAVG